LIISGLRPPIESKNAGEKERVYGEKESEKEKRKVGGSGSGKDCVLVSGGRSMKGNSDGKRLKGIEIGGDLSTYCH